MQYLCRLLHVPASTELSDLPEQAEVAFLGILQSVKPHLTKKQERMCFFQMEDETGTLECVAFPNVFRAIQQKLQPDTILWCKGRLSVQESGVSLLCSSVLTLEELHKLHNAFGFRTDYEFISKFSMRSIIKETKQKK